MTLRCALLLPMVLATVPTLSLANPALAQRKNCMSCHAVGARVVGPSFKEVAAKYAAQDDAAGQVAERIIKGSTGRWGFVPMPANAQVTPEEAQTLARWVLEQQ
jgi:cytochrome c